MKEVLKNRSVIFYCILAVVAFTVLRHHDMYISSDKEDYWEGIWVEAHGMFMDIIVLGLFLAIYDHYKDKRDKKDRYLEEIDDFRYWDEKEAMFRIVGHIRRLNKLDVCEINLQYCFLAGAKLEKVNLCKAKFNGANIGYTSFYKSNLADASFTGVFFNNTFLNSADLQRAVFYSANIESHTDFSLADMRNANLQRAKFIDTIFVATDMRSVKLKKLEDKANKSYWANFSNCHFKQVRAYEYQKQDFIDCGAEISDFIFE